MKRIGLLFSGAVISLLVAAAPRPETNKNARFNVPGVGVVRLVHSEPGEPISQPERLEVFVTCQGAKDAARIAVFRMCAFDGFDFEAGTKTLVVKLKYGRVEPKAGDVICDQFDMRPVELAQVCGKKR